ncbi:hypothetical protein F4801DRAFT_547117 [Xylaria longipes]|nr:hypothetical protein F4801DRAFT_547117 [Xylaria longipes]
MCLLTLCPTLILLVDISRDWSLLPGQEQDYQVDGNSNKEGCSVGWASNMRAESDQVYTTASSLVILDCRFPWGEQTAALSAILHIRASSGLGEINTRRQRMLQTGDQEPSGDRLQSANRGEKDSSSSDVIDA